jgi:hypothetical protein
MPATGNYGPDRTVKVATVEPGGVLVLFDDESCMKIKTAGHEVATLPSLLPGSGVALQHRLRPKS